jgi:hypothetical protein
MEVSSPRDAGPPPHRRARAGSGRDRRVAQSLLAGVPLSAHRRRAAGARRSTSAFADAAVLAAVAERAVATTLVTAEGRALTEITLWIRNRAQSYMKVALPPGASIVSVEVGGSPAEPVEGADGSRVPLLRPGSAPTALRGVVCVPARRAAVPEEGRHADDACRRWTFR